MHTHLAPPGPLTKGSPNFVRGRASNQLLFYKHSSPPLAAHLHAQGVVLCQSVCGEVACSSSHSNSERWEPNLISEAS